MPQEQLVICNDLGLHARAAARLVDCANGFESSVEITYRDRTVNAKSIMGVLMLAAAKGAEITLKTEGIDEQAALESVSVLVNDGFGEL